MKRNIIRITEGDLRRIVRATVSLIRESVDPHEEAMAMEYDRMAYFKHIEDECSVSYAFFPETMSLKPEYDLDYEDGDDYILVVITPTLSTRDNESLDIEDLDYIFDCGSDKAEAQEAEAKYGHFIDNWIDSNYESICDNIAEHSGYSIN